MIIINYMGRLGNQMCEYAIGRIIAEQKGFELAFNNSTLLSDYFPNAKPISGIKTTQNQLIMGIVGQPPHNTGQHLDINAAFNHNGMVILYGYWQKQWLYTPYIDKIKKWFEYDDSKYEKPNEGDVIIHYRLGDNIDLNRSLHPKFFMNIVKSLDYDRCIVVTDSPNEPVLNELSTLKNICLSGSDDVLEDFTLLKNSKRLILSPSTFSWWAAFLGNQDSVYTPLTEDCNIPYLKNNPELPCWTVHNSKCLWRFTPQFDDIDLIPDTNKYIKIKI